MKRLALSLTILAISAFQSGLAASINSPALESSLSAAQPPDSDTSPRPASKRKGRPRGARDLRPRQSRGLKSVLKKRPNRYVQYQTITDLVDSRPLQKEKKRMQEYLEAFAKHPDVLKIDPHQDKIRLAQDLVNLRDNRQKREWQRKLTLTLQRHLANANVDAEKIDEVLGYQHGLRIKKHADVHFQKQDQELRKQKDLERYHLRKHKRKESQRLSAQFIQNMDQLLKDSERRLTAAEVVKAAERFNGDFSSDRQTGYQRAVKGYLQRLKYPPDEVIMAQGVKSMKDSSVRQRNYKARIRAQKAAAAGDATATTSSQPALTQEESEGQDSTRTVLNFREGSTSNGMDSKETSTNDKARPTKKAKTEEFDQHRHGGQGIKHEENSGSIGTQAAGAASPSRKYSVEELEHGPWWENGHFD